MRSLRSAFVLGVLVLGGCESTPDAALPVEVIRSAPLAFTVEADGQSRGVKSTPLLVPGQQWAPRQLVWMKADGSRVEAGELVAEFRAPQGQLELDKAMLDLQRNALARSAKEDELGNVQGRV